MPVKCGNEEDSRYFRFNGIRGLEDIELEESKKKAKIAAATRRHRHLARRHSPVAIKSDTEDLNLHIIHQPNTLDGLIAYLSLVDAVGDPATFFSSPADDTRTLDFIRTTGLPSSKRNVFVAFGRHFLANSDLIFQIEGGIELNKYNRNTFCGAEPNWYNFYGWRINGPVPGPSFGIVPVF
ncbi:hypothetical protein ACHAQA_010068 [Verticillium albo-atrum]